MLCRHVSNVWHDVACYTVPLEMRCNQAKVAVLSKGVPGRICHKTRLSGRPMCPVQARCAELEDQQERLESQIRVSEQRCAATQHNADVLQRANVHLRQQLESSSATISKQVSADEPRCRC